MNAGTGAARSLTVEPECTHPTPPLPEWLMKVVIDTFRFVPKGQPEAKNPILRRSMPRS